MPEVDVLSDGVVLDATVPNWRFTVRGADGGGRRARPLVRATPVRSRTSPAHPSPEASS